MSQFLLSRRGAIAAAGLAAAGAGLATGRANASASNPGPHHARTVEPGDYPPGEPGVDYTPVVTPNGSTLPYRLVGGVKVFHLVAEEVEHEFAPGLTATCWGFNGQVHGPTIEAVEGDRVRIYVTNRLRAATSVHWHGLILPSGMDGVGGLTQRLIRPGETFRYEFPLVQHGTQMYHAHHDEMTQMAMGMMGMFVIHPRRAERRVDRDFALLLSTWKIRPGARRPDPNEMTDFNILTINAKAFPGTDPLVVRQDQKVRMRVANLSAMDHHPFHVHGHTFQVVGTDGGEIPEAGRWPEATVLVPVGSARTIEFVADNPGDWAVHCHMTHHVMNQMGHDIENMVGVDQSSFAGLVGDLVPGYMAMDGNDMAAHGEHVEMGHMAIPENSIPMVGAQGPFDYIGMGGMFTIMKVRPGITRYDDPGWYRAPDGTTARVATPGELSRDGIRT